MAQSLFLLLVVVLFLHFTTSASDSNTTTPPKFPAALFFGDSTLDTGNNDYIPTVAKGNHTPYGRDFTGGAATGRFSNGLLVPDLLSAELGIKQLSPPFMDPDLSDDEVLTGVNFAAAASGFDELTALMFKTISMSSQVDMFRLYLDRLRGIVGKEEAAMIVSRSLILVSAGANDLIFNYYDLPTRKGLSMYNYQDLLLHRASNFLEEVYNLGGRKFVVSGLPPIGCVPFQMTTRTAHIATRTCVDEQNADAQKFNSKLQTLLAAMQTSLPGSKFVFMDLYEAVMDILNNAAKYGFQQTTRGCCGTGLFEVGPFCNSLTPICSNVSSFVFYDSVHPTERVYKLLTNYLMNNVIPLLVDEAQRGGGMHQN